MKQAIEQFLSKHVGPDWSKKRYVLAVSGGLDSTVCLHLFQKILPGRRLVVAHFDHRIRKESASDARFVKLAAGRSDYVGGLRKQTGVSEAALRSERLHFLKTVQQQMKADYIVTAHHFEDQLETFFMRLLRGTGITGLSGMLPKRGVFLKPLLSLSKNDLAVYAKKHHLEFCIDETNQSKRYFRNQVRHSLLSPLYELAERHGGRKPFQKRFQALTRDWRRSQAFIEEVASTRLRALIVTTSFWLRISRTAFLSEPIIIQQAMLRHLFAALELEVPSRAKMAEVLRHLKKNKNVSGLGRVEIICSCYMVYFVTPEQRSKKIESPKVQGNLIHYKELGIRVSSAKFSTPPYHPRYFRPGDRVGNTKLKRILLEMRIPQPERGLIPVIEDPVSKRILWYYGSISPEFLITESKFPFANLKTTFY